MAPFEQQRPCIHVSLLPGTEASLYHWVQIGSEEEGVPCRLVSEQADDLVALAFAAAQSSRFNIGVGVSNTAVVLHETHMPPQTPVLVFEFSDQPDYYCRLMGSNAARMIIRMPFRFEDEPALFTNGDEAQLEAARTPSPISNVQAGSKASDLEVDHAQLAQIVTLIVQKLQERGIR
jgi:hypothetical protein